MERPIVMTIAGFDPSAGAGLLADIKTFESQKVYGFGVQTALTIQNDTDFKNIYWTPVNEIKQQISIIMDKYPVEWVKVGLIESIDVLFEVVSHLLVHNSEVKIIWDPILKASSTGFAFHEDLEVEKLLRTCSPIYMVMPNMNEIQKFFPQLEPREGAKRLSEYAYVLLKGGHGEGNTILDKLFYEGNKTVFESKRLVNMDKHGTGCVLSSAVTAQLAKGNTIEDAIAHGKEHTLRYIASSPKLLGYHI